MKRLSKEEVKDLVLDIPDKFQWPTTTSRSFKNRLIDEFYGSDCDVLEVGCHIGQTSKILSYLFNNVFAMNLNPPSSDFPTEENIIYEQMNSYSDVWKFDKWKNVDVVMIDAVHQYDQVKQDTENALKLNPKYIIFDDYGHPGFSGVKKYVDEFVEENNLKLIPIGLSDGEFLMENQKVIGSEGVIIKLGEKVNDIR